ncbi:longitudinals lacking protein, isoforms H/M/V-like isoform X2 [Macrosteles quadrilineatus]|uniref:longitudinals lacking protein, isoforms H/M/V-like isoform X2 n=1 Tax=Macrosteles quadrilineatus TaxID=74068 RepID=UPI0023E2FFAF|nr:longitudinals lacking protein, isoforms H/M/V-like isoform X2 [Macrosteles quadrilineatus]
MASDQQFCLRWNNHQSTLVSVFDNLLESQTLVDCTLAADGQYLKAHKVVLSACSPYLEAILCQNLDKHPILILKDVKFSELKAMLDYMYRGEVNISQEQLSTFLKAAESLQIKGLTDSGGGGTTDRERDPLKRQDIRKPLNQPVPHIPQPRPVVPHPGMMERRSLPHFPPHIADMQPQSPRHAREGSTSPTARKRRRPNRPSSDDSNFVSTPNSLSENQPDTSDSCDVPVKQAASLTPNVPNATTKAPETDSNRTTPQPQNNQVNSEQKQQVSVKKEFSEALLTPKTEFDYGNDNSMEDVTYEDDEEEEVDLSKPGTSFAANSQGFPPWQMGGDGSNDDSNNMYSPDVTATTNQNNSQDLTHSRYLKCLQYPYTRAPPPVPVVEKPPSPAIFQCPQCSKVYNRKGNLGRHMRYECGKAPQFHCHLCEKSFFRREKLDYHVKSHALSLYP